jgi:hypothetical protein
MRIPFKDPCARIVVTLNTVTARSEFGYCSFYGRILGKWAHPPILLRVEFVFVWSDTTEFSEKRNMRLQKLPSFLLAIRKSIFCKLMWWFEKILSTPSFGGEVKPSVPCRRSAACKRSLEFRGSRILDEICRNISRPRRVPPCAARGLSRCWTWRHLAEVGTSKGGGKQWHPTTKNLPKMQCARAIPVAWLSSGSC